jgi:hypothetical protein
LSWSLSNLGFDAYERRARLYPGLIAIFPAIAVPLVLLPHTVFGNFGKMFIAAIAYVGLFYLLTNIARTEGKRIEPRLLQSWGGWPTTILLRHSDNTIDIHTKQRYHGSLAKLAPNLPLPSVASERRNLSKADDVYRSLTKKLLEKRRGEKYRLVSDANAEYGFRRNMLGLKPWAIGVGGIVAGLILLVWWFPYRAYPISELILETDLGKRWKIYLLFPGDLAAISFWIFYVRESWVRQSAFDFAHALFRTLE